MLDICSVGMASEFCVHFVPGVGKRDIFGFLYQHLKERLIASSMYRSYCTYNVHGAGETIYDENCISCLDSNLKIIPT
jgi:hypothetical protein